MSDETKDKALKQQIVDLEANNQQLTIELAQRNHELQLLNRVNHAFISTRDLNRVLATVLEEVRQSLKVVACSAWLVDTETGDLVCRQVTDPQSKVVRGWRVSPGDGFVGWVAQNEQTLNIPDKLADSRHYQGVDTRTGLDLRSILSVPLRVKDNIIGVIQVVDASPNRFSLADQSLLESLAATTSIAIENARLYDQAHQDAETRQILLQEVNHRVKNNLTAIIGLLYAKLEHAELKDRPAYRGIMKELVSWVQGLATVHNMLSASDWTPLPLSNLAEQVVHSALQARPSDRLVTIYVAPSPVLVTPAQAHNLALIINELATNALKHGILSKASTLQINITVLLQQDEINFTFRDNGPGYPSGILQLDTQHFNVGFDLIQNIIRRNLRGHLCLSNNKGAITQIKFMAEIMAGS